MKRGPGIGESRAILDQTRAGTDGPIRLPVLEAEAILFGRFGQVVPRGRTEREPRMEGSSQGKMGALFDHRQTRPILEKRIVEMAQGEKPVAQPEPELREACAETRFGRCAWWSNSRLRVKAPAAP
jgi:hypothetical protein